MRLKFSVATPILLASGLLVAAPIRPAEYVGTPSVDGFLELSPAPLPGFPNRAILIVFANWEDTPNITGMELLRDVSGDPGSVFLGLTCCTYFDPLSGQIKPNPQSFEFLDASQVPGDVFVAIVDSNGNSVNGVKRFVNVVPEPSGAALIALGLLALGFAAVFRRALAG